MSLLNLKILFIQYSLESLELILIIFNAAFVIGMLWIVVCELHEDFFLKDDLRGIDDDHEHIGDEYFLLKFGLLDMSLKKSVIVATYFAFTTFSTVGFGVRRLLSMQRVL